MSNILGEVLKRLLLSSIQLGGFRGWLIKTIAESAFDQFVVPFIEYVHNKGMVKVDKQSGKIKLRKLEEAENAGDIDTWRDVISRV